MSKNIFYIKNLYINLNIIKMKKSVLKFFSLFSIFILSYQSNAQIESRITCISGNQVSESKIGDYLSYELNLTDFLEKDSSLEISFNKNQFDISTLIITNVSIYETYKITSTNTSNVVSLKPKHCCCMHSIMCCPKNTGGVGPPGGHGGILLKIKTNDFLTNGTIVSVEASIKDLNSFVINNSNIEETVLGGNLSYYIDESITAYPIPANSNITVSCNSLIKSVSLLDSQNQIIETIFSNDPSKSLDISTKLDGVYYIKVTSDVGQKVIRIIKQ